MVIGHTLGLSLLNRVLLVVSRRAQSEIGLESVFLFVSKRVAQMLARLGVEYSGNL